jgi:C4-dicarboxylate-specific signal transduction histidine kinase
LRSGFRMRVTRHGVGYGVAVLATAVCLAVRWPLWPVLGDAVPHMGFFPAVMLGAYFGGFGPGMLATLLSVLAANYFFTEQFRSFHVTNVNDVAGAILFVVVGTIISALSESLHRARRRALEQQRQRAEAQMELARINRVATIGQLTASIAHEVNQPISALITQASAALRWLEAEPPDVDEVRQALNAIIRDGNRAGDVVARVRALVKRVPPRRDPLDINDIIPEVVALTRSEIRRNGVSLQTQLATDLPIIQGDRVQLQQVLLNLIVNAVEAMAEVSERQLLIKTGINAQKDVIVELRDTGPGFKPDQLEHVFDAFYTTKLGGIGVGLAICRSIIEAHGGRISAAANPPRGAVLQFTLPAQPDARQTLSQ